MLKAQVNMLTECSRNLLAKIMSILDNTSHALQETVKAIVQDGAFNLYNTHIG